MTEIQKENKDNVNEGRLFFLPLNINLSLLLPKYKKPKKFNSFLTETGTLI